MAFLFRESKITVYLGASDISQWYEYGSQRYHSTKIYTHPWYDDEDDDIHFDIALVRLPSAAILNCKKLLILRTGLF
jgi:hypothetical protein